MLIPIASLLVGIAEPPVTPALLVTPVVNTTLIIREVLIGHAHIGQFLLALVSSCFYAGLVLSFTARVFTNEQLVNPAWEPISLRGLRTLGSQTAARRCPAIDEAMVLFAVSLLLNFYVSPSWLKYGLLGLVVGVEVLLIAAPAIVFGIIGRYRWRSVFSLRPPTLFAMGGALLLGLGLIPIVNTLTLLQQSFHILPQSQRDMEGMSQLFEPVLRAHPFLTPILVGVLAGVCEELLFRGPIQSALMRGLSVPTVLFVGGLLFAAAHVDLSGAPIRFGLGVVLGWVVWRTGSIFPAMLLHGLYDGTQLAWDTYGLLHHIADPTALLTPAAGVLGLIVLLIGIAAAIAGAMLIRSHRIPSDADAPPLQTRLPVAALSM